MVSLEDVTILNRDPRGGEVICANATKRTAPFIPSEQPAQGGVQTKTLFNLGVPLVRLLYASETDPYSSF